MLLRIPPRLPFLKHYSSKLKNHQVCHWAVWWLISVYNLRSRNQLYLTHLLLNNLYLISIYPSFPNHEQHEKPSWKRHTVFSTEFFVDNSANANSSSLAAAKNRKMSSVNNGFTTKHVARQSEFHHSPETKATAKKHLLGLTIETKPKQVTPPPF